jgi:hypothetical protein
LNKLASIWLFVPARDPLTAADANGRHEYGYRQAIHTGIFKRIVGDYSWSTGTGVEKSGANARLSRRQTFGYLHGEPRPIPDVSQKQLAQVLRPSTALTDPTDAPSFHNCFVCFPIRLCIVYATGLEVLSPWRKGKSPAQWANTGLPYSVKDGLSGVGVAVLGIGIAGGLEGLGLPQ